MSEMLYQRDIYGKTLLELGRQDKNIVVLDADLSGSTRTAVFGREFPDRFFNFGVAEQNMMATAAGLASCGKKVFASTFAMFATGRAWDQVRNSICYSRLNVKIVGTHAGITVGPDGATHQALEDIALMRVIPNMRVIVPCDGPETKAAIIAAAKTDGPVYIRLGRAKVPTIDGKQDFILGKAYVLSEGKDLAIIACGIMVKYALDAQQQLLKEGIKCTIVNMHTIKPLDTDMLKHLINKTKGIVICEEHSVIGGLGCAVEEEVLKIRPKPIIRIGVQDRFGQSGEPEVLLRAFNLQATDIVLAAKKLLKNK